MKGILIFMGILALCAAIIMPVLYFTTDIFTEESKDHFTPPPNGYTPAPPNGGRVIFNVNNLVLHGGHYENGSDTIRARETISVSWEADGSVYVWILTQTQYDYFKMWGTHFDPEELQTGRSGTLTHYVANTDTYYVIIHNISLFKSIKIYSAVARVQ